MHLWKESSKVPRSQVTSRTNKYEELKIKNKDNMLQANLQPSLFLAFNIAVSYTPLSLPILICTPAL
jgi:hypothetical protein